MIYSLVEHLLLARLVKKLLLLWTQKLVTLLTSKPLLDHTLCYFESTTKNFNINFNTILKFTTNSYKWSLRLYFLG
jgi:hypothetical protein